MNKSCKFMAPFAAAVLACSVGNASAETDISFYGLIDVWAGSTERPSSTDKTYELGSGGMSTSFLGFTATHTLTDNLKAIGGVEMFFRPDSAEDGRYGGDEFFARGAYVGLDGPFGQIKGGRNTAPYFLPMVFSNPFGDSFVFSPSILHSFQGGNNGPIVGDSGWSNSISYTTPSLGGVRVNAVYAFGEQAGSSSENKIGANVVFRSGPLLLVAAGHDISEGGLASSNNFSGERGALGGSEQKAMMIGGAYDFEFIKVFAQYQELETELLLGGDVDTDTWQLGFSAPVGPGSVLASYANSDFTGVRDFERKTWSLGYNYLVTKKLDLYGVFMRDDIDTTGTGNTWGLGARYRF